jgi:hypothetical protein
MQTLNIPLLHERDAEERDGENAPPIVWINETLLKRYGLGKMEASIW